MTKFKVRSNTTAMSGRNDYVARQKRAVETLPAGGHDTTDAMALFANSLLQSPCRGDDNRSD
jgi:hypothetical protein